jgi:hypothetical protein
VIRPGFSQQAVRRYIPSQGAFLVKVEDRGAAYRRFYKDEKMPDDAGARIEAALT